MKRVIKVFLTFSVLFLVVFSCSKEDDSAVEKAKSYVDDIKLSKTETALRKFEKSIINAKTKIRDRKDSKNTSNLKTEHHNYDVELLLNELLIPSISFMEDYGFTTEDYYEMFGTYDLFEIQNEIAGAGIFYMH